jgi:regulator of protease activity HflC (stomatin/prohibitin superfamily)
MIKWLYDRFNQLVMRVRILVKEHQRALLFDKGRFIRVLQPGVYHVWNLFGDLAYEVHDVTTLAFSSPYLDTLLKQHPDVVAQHFFVADVADQQVAILSVDGKVYTVLPPGTRQLYWKTLRDIAMELVNIAETCEIPKEKLPMLARLNSPHILSQIVPESSVGLLFVDGKLAKTLPPGLYGFWRTGRNIQCETIDTRLQQVDVTGQELLTKDRISLRVTLTCWFVVADPVKAKTSVSHYADHLYKEVQFGVREAVSVKTLDELLDDKDSLNPVVFEYVRAKLKEIGIEVRSVGVKDLILPGDMREMVNKVIEAKKLAEANQIKRREEVAATRSLLNTAKIIDDHPILLRLKELETLEKMAEQIQNLHVYGGFDQLLNGLISLKTPKREKPSESAEIIEH